jgi:hypothetical protein
MKSNCLFEALKAKIKNPEVKIHFISPSLNNGRIHFYWIDDEAVWQFTHKQPVKIPLFFEGRTRRHNAYCFEGKMFQKMKELGWSIEKQRDYANKKGFLNKEPFELELDRD